MNALISFLLYLLVSFGVIVLSLAGVLPVYYFWIFVFSVFVTSVLFLVFRAWHQTTELIKQDIASQKGLGEEETRVKRDYPSVFIPQPFDGERNEAKTSENEEADEENM